MLRYMTDRARPGLVALYDIQPGNAAGQFLQPRSSHRVPFRSLAYCPPHNFRSDDDPGYLSSCTNGGYQYGLRARDSELPVYKSFDVARCVSAMSAIQCTDSRRVSPWLDPYQLLTISLKNSMIFLANFSVLIIGDLNIHTDISADQLKLRFLQLFDMHQLTQHVALVKHVI